MENTRWETYNREHMGLTVLKYQPQEDDEGIRSVLFITLLIPISYNKYTQIYTCVLHQSLSETMWSDSVEVPAPRKMAREGIMYVVFITVLPYQLSASIQVLDPSCRQASSEE